MHPVLSAAASGVGSEGHPAVTAGDVSSVQPLYPAWIFYFLLINRRFQAGLLSAGRRAKAAQKKQNTIKTSW